MKVLYANPIFLDYRLPFYKRLNELFGGGFYIMYSANRYKGRYDSLLAKIPRVMGENAIAFEGEALFNTYERSFKRYNTEKGKKIPFTHGFLRAVWRLNPDVLITEGFFQWTPLVILYSVLRRKPVFMGYERTCHTERNAGPIKKLHRKLTDLFITGYLVNGSETTKYLLSLGVKAEKIHIGGMNADSAGLVDAIRRFPEAERRAFRSRYSHGGLIYLFSGQVVVRKGVGHLLEAWTEHVGAYPNDTLVLIGYGDLYEGFKERYGGMPSVFLEGRVEYDSVYKYYAVADVFVLPTIEDNWSLVVPEAMACGLPVATSIYNGCHTELVKEGKNGTTFDTFDHASIVRALDFFHHADLAELGRNSVELEKPFNAESCARREYEAIMAAVGIDIHST